MKVLAFRPRRPSRAEILRLVRDARCGPALAGMDPLLRPVYSGDARFPRTRGDGPPLSGMSGSRSWFPPHARGWTAARHYRD